MEELKSKTIWKGRENELKETRLNAVGTIWEPLCESQWSNCESSCLASTCEQDMFPWWLSALCFGQDKKLLMNLFEVLCSVLCVLLFFFYFEVLGMEASSLYMVGKCFTTELYPNLVSSSWGHTYWSRYGEVGSHSLLIDVTLFCFSEGEFENIYQYPWKCMYLLNGQKHF
jgi:hypothetical protein